MSELFCLINPSLRKDGVKKFDLALAAAIEACAIDDFNSIRGNFSHRRAVTEIAEAASYYEFLPIAHPAGYNFLASGLSEFSSPSARLAGLPRIVAHDAGHFFVYRYGFFSVSFMATSFAFAPIFHGAEPEAERGEGNPVDCRK